MAISLPAIGLRLQARGLGKGQIKRSGRRRMFRTITSAIAADQDGELVIRVAHLEIGLVIWGSGWIMLLVLLTEQVASSVNVT
jgi:hypothetical protein